MNFISPPPIGNKIIRLEKGRLEVNDNPIVCFIEGDGIGPEIMKNSMIMWDAAIEKAYGRKRRISWMELYAGEKARSIYGENIYLPAETVNAIKEYTVAIKGPLTTPVAGGIRSLNVTLRQELDLYACVRPIRHFRNVPSPVCNPDLTDMVVFRENTEDTYMGIEWQANSHEVKKVISFLLNEMKVENIRFPDSSAVGIKIVSRKGSERLIRSAIRYAIENKRKSVTLVHKGNIMKFTEGSFREWGYALAKKEFSDHVICATEYTGKIPSGKILIKDCICDAFFQDILLCPEEYDVIASLNLNGDYISDALAACVGGIGIAPGANINYETNIAIFEATHGTAPKLAGLNKANPCSLALSGAMLLRYINWNEAADILTTAIERCISSKKVTCDFAKIMANSIELSCSEFAKTVTESIMVS